MPLFFKDEFNVYRKMLFRESHKSIAGLNILNNFVQKIHDCVTQSTDVHEIQRNIRLLSIFCQILETFNANIEMLLLSIDENTFKEVMDTSTNAICLRVKDWITDLSSYQIDDTFTGFVSYVLDGDTKLCFIKDMTRHSIIDFKDYLESAFDGIPPYGYIFAAELNQKYFRAIRIDSEATNMAFRVRLIDIGETVALSPNACKYNLVNGAKKIPPMAILCYVKTVNNKVIASLDPIYKKMFCVKIKNVCVNMLEVELTTQTDLDNEVENQTLEKSIIACVQSSTNGDELMSVSSTENIRLPTSTPTLNPFISEISEQNTQRTQSPLLSNGLTPPEKQVISIPKSIPARPTLPPVPPRQRPKSLASIRIPLDIVRRQKSTESEQSNTSHVETNGKPSKPASEINETFQQNGNSCHIETASTCHQHDPPCSCPCQSGAHPKHPQTRKENGFIKAPTTPERLPLPYKGEEASVTPTHVLGPDQIYVQFTEFTKQFEAFQYSTLQKVQLKQLSYIPKPNDFVLASYNADHHIYRARIESITQQTVKVFYIDYGNTEFVDFDGLFEWDPVCYTIPFQAVLCRLANVRNLTENSAQTLYNHIQTNYLNKFCKAFVVDIGEKCLLVKMKNSNGRDIVEEVNLNVYPECIV